MNSLSLGPLVLLQPWWLLLAFVLLLLSCVFRGTVDTNDWQRVLTKPVFAFLNADSGNTIRWNFALWAATLVALAQTQPVIRHSDDDIWRHSIGWIAVMDVSRSMTLEDITPSRLSVARNALSTLSAESGSRPIGLIIYAGDAFLVAPPAFDKSIFNQHAALLDYGVIPAEGSNLARALSLATSVISDSQLIAARVFLLSDSAGIGNDAMAAARYLNDSGHSLDVLLTGTPATAQSDAAETRVDLAAAQALATAGGGISVHASVFGEFDYEALKLGDQATASSHGDLHTLVWNNQSHWLLLGVIPLLLLVFRQEQN